MEKAQSEKTALLFGLMKDTMPKIFTEIWYFSGYKAKLRHSFFFGIVCQDCFKDDTESH